MDWNKRATRLLWQNEWNPLCLNINGEITSDPKSIAEKFNTFFVNIAPKLVPKLKPGKTKFHEYLTTQYSNNLFMSPVPTDEVNSLLAILI